MEQNSIKKFYAGGEIFVTGGSGFIGRVLIEKLLRSCEEISKIYLLMRGKKGVEARDRIHKLTDCMLFEKLKAENPKALEKLEVIEGNMMQIGLGISNENLQKLKNCTHIFHCAASVRFDDPLKDAIIMNTRGTREVCEMATKMTHLKCLVHVSTTFIQPKLYSAEEIFYPADFQWQKFIQMAEKFDHDMLNCLDKKLTKFAPNTYTFTKHLAEQVCLHYRDNSHSNLPIVIYRPSVVASKNKNKNFWIFINLFTNF
jgi:thioester reductase-like protein